MIRLTNLVRCLLIRHAIVPGLLFVCCYAEAQSDRFNEADLQLNFPNAPVTAILPYYEKLTRKKIIRDGNLEGENISLVTDSKLNREDAIHFINSALLLNGYAILPVDPTTLKIINYNNGKSIRAQQLPVVVDPLAIPDTEQVINYVMPLTHVTPEEAIETFSQIVTMNPFGAMTPLEKSNSVVITESTTVIKMLLNFKNHVDAPPSNVIHEFVKLERADAEKVAEIINGIIDEQVSATSQNRPVITPGQQGKGAKIRPPSITTGNEPIGVSIVPYRRTNSILVVAPPADFMFIEDLITSFDRPGDGVNFMKRKLQYVSVMDYMSSFYNALARGTDISQPEDQLENQASGGNRESNAAPNRSRGNSQGGGATLAGDLLGSPDDVGAPVSYTVGNTLLIGDPQANSLVVSGSPENIRIIDQLIDEIDVQPMQVYLSTIIGQLTIGDNMDYSLNALQSLGTFRTPSNRLSGAASLFNGSEVQPDVSSLNTPGAFPSAFKGLSLYGRFAWGENNAGAESMLRVFAQESRFKILSRPSIYAQNNVKATISSGQRIAIPTSTLTSAGGFNNTLGGAITSNIEFRDVVLKLEVIPLINSDNQVTLKIAQVNDNIVGSQTISGNQIPTLSTQELITTVTINHGETMVLGGLITERADETVTGLPGIRNIPFLGKALGSTSESSTREELLIFIQPHIVNGIDHRTPNDLEKCRNSVFCPSMEFGNPDPPECCPPNRPISAAIQATPVNTRRWGFRFRQSKK